VRYQSEGGELSAGPMTAWRRQLQRMQRAVNRSPSIVVISAPSYSTGTSRDIASAPGLLVRC
jgi:hypothetical protein